MAISNPSNVTMSEAIISSFNPSTKGLQMSGASPVPAHVATNITYVAAGNGVGNVETVTYYSDAAKTVSVGVMTLTYNALNKVSGYVFVGV